MKRMPSALGGGNLAWGFSQKHTHTYPHTPAVGVTAWGQAPSWPHDHGAGRVAARPPPQTCYPAQPHGDEVWGGISLISLSGVAQTSTKQDGTFCSALLHPLPVHGRYSCSKSNSITYLFIIHSRRSLGYWINMWWPKWGCFFKMPLQLFFFSIICAKWRVYKQIARSIYTIAQDI